jgi:hypothetical protein
MFYIKKLVRQQLLQGLQGLQGSHTGHEDKINNKSKSMLVLLARSVSVAEAIIPISITKSISFEIFITTPFLIKKIFFSQKNTKNILG